MHHVVVLYVDELPNMFIFPEYPVAPIFMLGGYALKVPQDNNFSKIFAMADSVTDPESPARTPIDAEMHATITKPLLVDDIAVEPATNMNPLVHQLLATGLSVKN